MRELSERLYLTRREFVKGLVAVGVVAGTAGLSGCLEYIKPKTPKPAETPKPTESPVPSKRKFRYGFDVVGSEEDKRMVAVLMDNLKQYSPEWYEKTMWAAEEIELGVYDAGAADGRITLHRESVYAAVKSGDVKRILTRNATFPHEVQHVIDGNTYWIGREDIPMPTIPGTTKGLESELRAGIAGDSYEIGIGLCYEKGDPIFCTTERARIETYNFRVKRFNDDKEKVDQLKYKDRLDAIEQKYFDHENKKLKTNFPNESWEQFKKLYL